MKASESLQNDQSTATEDALRRAVDTTPAFNHTARPDGYLDYFDRRWLDFLVRRLGWRWNARRTVGSGYSDSDPLLTRNTAVHRANGKGGNDRTSGHAAVP